MLNFLNERLHNIIIVKHTTLTAYVQCLVGVRDQRNKHGENHVNKQRYKHVEVHLRENIRRL